MARPLRIEFPGALYHVTSRGDRREDIYGDDRDRTAWLELLGAVCGRFGWVCHAYCQMTNHYHLVIETPEANLSKGMRHLNGVYTQYVNRTYHKTGHVFQGRFKAILVEKDSYLLELVRYVALNPVRAGMVKEAGMWLWSSYRATAGLAEAPAWLQTAWTLSQFSLQAKRARAKYAEFVRAGVGTDSLWDQLRYQIYLGSDDFISQVVNGAEPVGDVAEVPRGQKRPIVEPLSYYHDRDDKREGMALAYRDGRYSMKAIAEYFGVHYSTVSRAVKEFEK